MRVWFNGRIPASQAGDAGSIPVTRSTNGKDQITSGLFHLMSKLGIEPERARASNETVR